MNRSFLATAVVILAGHAAGQRVTTLVGTGDPAIDVPAVQAAVDQGGHVTLKGHFSFDTPPTVAARFNGALGTLPTLGTILISKAVAISGMPDDQGEMTTIEDGTTPFYIEAPGARIRIQGLHFIHSKSCAILVVAAHDVVIESNKIEGPVRAMPLNFVYGISLVGNVDAFAAGYGGGNADDLAGTLRIANNDIDLQAPEGGGPFIAIEYIGVGKSPDREADVYISGNNIVNSSERPINIYSVGGRAYIERNSITTSSGPGINVMPSGDVMHIVGPGSFLIAHNTINCLWSSGLQAGIRLMTRANEPVSHALVVENDINMSAPEGTKFGATSAAIEVRGAGADNIVANNRISGRANFALSVVGQNGTPQSTAFSMNDLSGFSSAQADVFVDAGGTNTIVVGAQGTVEDHGSGTIIVPVH
jgi:hypothetical protein